MTSAAHDIQDLTAASQPEFLQTGQYRWLVPDGWQQGRGAFGGLVLATMLRAVEHALNDPSRELRSLTATLCGPSLAGAAEIEVGEVRTGSGTSTWGATVTQQGEVRARLTAILGKSRPIEHLFQTPKAPPPQAWQQLPVAPLGPPFAPVFTQHFEFRLTGPLPFSGAEQAQSSGWVRPRRAGSKLGMAELVALADAWWPAALGMESAPRPIGTIAFTMQPLAHHLSLDSDVPVFHRAQTLAAHQGFVVEQRELWSADGTLLALNQQTFAWIR